MGVRNELNVTKAMKPLIDKYSKFGSAGEATLERIIKKITLLTQAAVIDKITNDVPHTIKYPARNLKPGETRRVDDLVDTGAYRQSWQVSFPSKLKGEVSTNNDHAVVLELGTDDGSRPAYDVAGSTAKKMRERFRQELKDGLREMLR